MNINKAYNLKSKLFVNRLFRPKFALSAIAVMTVFSGACPVSFNVRLEIFFYKILSEPNYTRPPIYKQWGALIGQRRNGQNWISDEKSSKK